MHPFAHRTEELLFHGIPGRSRREISDLSQVCDIHCGTAVEDCSESVVDAIGSRPQSPRQDPEAGDQAYGTDTSLPIEKIDYDIGVGTPGIASARLTVLQNVVGPLCS